MRLIRPAAGAPMFRLVPSGTVRVIFQLASGCSVADTLGCFGLRLQEEHLRYPF